MALVSALHLITPLYRAFSGLATLRLLLQMGYFSGSPTQRWSREPIGDGEMEYHTLLVVVHYPESSTVMILHNVFHMEGEFLQNDCFACPCATKFESGGYTQRVVIMTNPSFDGKDETKD